MGSRDGDSPDFSGDRGRRVVRTEVGAAELEPKLAEDPQDSLARREVGPLRLVMGHELSPGLVTPCRNIVHIDPAVPVPQLIRSPTDDLVRGAAAVSQSEQLAGSAPRAASVEAAPWPRTPFGL